MSCSANRYPLRRDVRERRDDATPKPENGAQVPCCTRSEHAYARKVFLKTSFGNFTSNSSRSKRPYSDPAERTAEQERTIRKEIDRKDAEKEKQGGKPQPSPMQAGARRYPGSFAEQHQEKPGHEAALEPAPMYEAPAYEGSGKPRDKVALITGGGSPPRPPRCRGAAAHPVSSLRSGRRR